MRALWGLASWALPLAVIFFVTPPLLRALGAERFGVLMICLVMPLLATKLYIPPLRSNLLSRPQLMQRLSDEVCH